MISRAEQQDLIVESQNVVIKDLYDKVHTNAKRLTEFESIDLDDRFNQMTRKMIADVCRGQLTPVQMNTNLEIKALRRLVDE